MSMDECVPFNPLDKESLVVSIERALLAEEPHALGEINKFAGAGIYALRYTGSYPAYKLLSEINNGFLAVPVYVGKADSKGKRKGGYLAEGTREPVLWNRLRDHAVSIEQARNLDIEDFMCRFLVVDDLWIGLGESLPISKFAPVRNTFVDGFGNHDSGKGRRAGRRSRWDTLHPGRVWADSLADNPMSAEQIAREVEEYVAARYDVVEF